LTRVEDDETLFLDDLVTYADSTGGLDGGRAGGREQSKGLQSCDEDLHLVNGNTLFGKVGGVDIIVYLTPELDACVLDLVSTVRRDSKAKMNDL
jgi:hypothetical protein